MPKNEGSARRGKCGKCGHRLEQWDKGGAVLLLCEGCGLVVGRGAQAEAVIEETIADGMGARVPSVPGIFAMQLGRPAGGPQ